MKYRFRWVMELWFAPKVAEAWVTFVSTHLSCDVLSLKSLLGSTVLKAEDRKKNSKENWRVMQQ